MITHSGRTAIVTAYLGPTKHRGARIKAESAQGNRVIISYPYDLPRNDHAHAAAAQALCDKMGWTGNLRSGGAGNAFVFVFVD